MTTEFGNPKAVNLRDIWEYETNDFTPWLADNLNYISDAIGVPLELARTEASVGRFSADILARAPDGEFAIIENQLESSDHSHLGQTLAYLAGLGARTAVWVARDFEEEHLAAIRWLNENTAADFSFFAVRVWAANVGDSPPSPRFDVLELPSDWDSEIRAAAQANRDAPAVAQPSRKGQSARGGFNRDFWTHHTDRHPDDGLRRGFAGFNPVFPVLGTEFSIKWYHAGRNQVGMWVMGPRGKWSRSIRAALKPYLPALAQAAGAVPDESLDMESAHIRLDIDISNPDNWQRAADWLHEKHEIYRRILSQPPR